MTAASAGARSGSSDRSSTGPSFVPSSGGVAPDDRGVIGSGLESTPPATLITGGIVAYNEERCIRAAVLSLLEQDLPDGFTWDRILVVASGCTDRTVELAQGIDPRVEVLVEPERRGKASALRQIFARASGEFLVLLNADAQADPSAVRSMLGLGRGSHEAFVVMGRPVPRESRDGPTADGIQLLWDLHHELHRAALSSGSGTHVSDELLLLPSRLIPPLPASVVNDGAFIGAWLKRNGGHLAYAPTAVVAIETPRTMSDHLSQRRRILWGHAQVGHLTGLAPTTLQRFARDHPVITWRMVTRSVRARPHGVRALCWLAGSEWVASVLSLKDRLRPAADPTRWRTISS
jgi:poly-beta-1,6-N-acetyl-D-glucosamine synthase